MKLNKIFFAAALCLGFVACQEEVEYTPAPAVPAGTPNVYFQTSNELGVEIDPADNITSREVVVLRDSSTIEKELIVDINVLQNDSNKFVVPESVTFEAGSTTSTITIGFEGLQVAETYTLAIELDKEAIDPYHQTAVAASYTVSITPIKWERGVGVYTDNIVINYWSIEQLTWYVDYKITTLPDGSKRLVVINPYGKRYPGDDTDEGMPALDANGIYEAWAYNWLVSNKDVSWDLSFEISSDNKVKLNFFQTGVDYKAAELFAADYGGTGTYIPDSSVIFDAADQAIVWGFNNAPYGYLGLEVYLSLEAYLASQVVEGSGCEISDYEGTFLCLSLDMLAAEPTPQQDTVAIDYVADYGLYILQGLPGISVAAGQFDEETQLLHIPMQALPHDSVYAGGVGYGAVLYPLSNSGQLTNDDLVFIANEDGTITFDESSKTCGYLVLATLDGKILEDAEGYVVSFSGYQIGNFTPVTPDEEGETGGEGEGTPSEIPALYKLQDNSSKTLQRVPMLPLDTKYSFIR